MDGIATQNPPAAAPAEAQVRLAVACDLCGANEPVTLFEKTGDTFVRCPRCNLVYLYPQPSDSELSAIYGAHYYDSWGLGDAATGLERLKKRTFALMLERMRAQTGVAGGALLDLGCATGFLLSVAQGMGFTPYGVELNAFSAEKAKAAFGDANIHCGRIEDAPFPASSFEVIVMSDLLEHVRKPTDLLARVHDLLKPDGVAVVVAPDVGGLSHLLLGNHWTDFKREHLWYYDRRTLRATLARASLRVVKMSAFPKYLSLEYIHRQLETFHTPGLTQLARLAHKAAPRWVAERPFPIFAGSMMAVARKR